MEHITEALWSAVTIQKLYPVVDKNLEVDVAIIGGGITGLSAAYVLSQARKKVAVLEAMHIGRGTTGTSTGNLYAPVGGHLHTIRSKHNLKTMKMVAQSRTAAVNFIEGRVKEFQISCEFERVPWYLFSEPGNDLMAIVEKEREACEQAGLTVSNDIPANFPFKADAITYLPNQAQFNPLKYAQGLAAAIVGENCQIFEDTKVLKVEDGEPCIIQTENGMVRAKQIVMATHSPKGVYGVHTAMEPYREFAIAFKLKTGLPAGGIYWHLQQLQHYSVRPYKAEQGEYLLVLGEAYKVGHEEHNEEKLKLIEAYARKHFDIDSIAYSWAAQNYRPADGLPFIGTSPLEKNIYIATGFAVDGLTYGTLAGMIISDQIQGKENEYAKIYDPKRFTPVASALNFTKENLDVAVSLVKDHLLFGEVKELDEIKAGEGKTLEIHGEKVAAYRDDKGELHVVSAVCTHMGCIVHFNNAEKSWDCPCHGSRFGVDGIVLEGPAYLDLEKKDTTKGA
jgi:glycine/D-amino acid oxidase-like deaminating enzyme/nitrite reductase/ring-hydroxylating ferredoxin subunit